VSVSLIALLCHLLESIGRLLIKLYHGAAVSGYFVIDLSIIIDKAKFSDFGQYVCRLNVAPEV